MIRGTYILANIGVRLQGHYAHPHRRVTHTVHGTRVRLDPTYNIAASTGTSTFIFYSEEPRRRRQGAHVSIVSRRLSARRSGESLEEGVHAGTLHTKRTRRAMRRPRINPIERASRRSCRAESDQRVAFTVNQVSFGI